MARNTNSLPLCVYSDCFLRPLRHPWVLGWSSNGSILLDWQEADWKSPHDWLVLFSYILWCTYTVQNGLILHHTAVSQFDTSCNPSLHYSPPAPTLHLYMRHDFGKLTKLSHMGFREIPILSIETAMVLSC